MKLLRKLTYATITVLALGACTDLSDDLYDTIPADKYPENATQASRIAAPAFLKVQGLTTSWGGYWMAQEISGDGIVAPTRAKDWDDGGKWRDLHTHNWGASTQAVRGIWKEQFSGIALCNQAIESLEANAENPEVAQVLAQLKVMRGFYYYILIDCYGDVPYVTSFKNAEAAPKRTPRAEVFNNIVTEVSNIIDLLPEPSIASSINKGTAYALLAKLYINAEVFTGTPQWSKANDMCDALIALDKYRLEADVKSPFVTANENSVENIYTIPYDEDNMKEFNLHMRTLHYESKATFNMAVQPWNGFAVIKDRFDSYEDSDKRKDWFLYGEQFAFDGTSQGFTINPEIPALNMDNSYSDEEIKNSGARVIKFEIAPGAGQDLSNDYPIFRYADFLLIKAEALIRMGKDGDKFINEVRNRAGLDNLSGTTLAQVLEERGKEMIWEGTRRQDMIRFGAYNKAWWEKAESPSWRNIFPVPQDQINTNANLLPQNTGY
jgi:hypothetical protein